MQVERRRGRNEEVIIFKVCKPQSWPQEAHESIIYLSDSFVMKLSVAYMRLVFDASPFRHEQFAI